jgi:hypothetical protein
MLQWHNTLLLLHHIERIEKKKATELLYVYPPAFRPLLQTYTSHHNNDFLLLVASVFELNFIFFHCDSDMTKLLFCVTPPIIIFQYPSVFFFLQFHKHNTPWSTPSIEFSVRSFSGK